MANNQKTIISQDERRELILDLLSDVQNEASVLHNALAQVLRAAESSSAVGNIVDGDALRDLVSSSRAFCEAILACESGIRHRQSVCQGAARRLAPIVRPARRKRAASRISA